MPDSPTPTPPAAAHAPMWVGLNANNFTVSGDIKDIAEAVSYVRVPCPTAESVANALSAGVKVIACIAGDISDGYAANAYNTGGVRAINPAKWADNAYEWFTSLPPASQSNVVAIEVLNEPYGKWFWGPNAGAFPNYLVYMNLLAAVHAKFHQLPSRPLILASWVEVGVGIVDGVVVHPYGGHGPTSAQGDRTAVENAHRTTGRPVYVTEVGWPTAVGKPPTGDSLQWTEAEQAANITSFIEWAKGTGYVNAVCIFNDYDYTSDGGTVWNWYGLIRGDASRKPGYAALAQLRTL